MTRLDRPLTRALAGVMVLLCLNGCRSARYQTAERPATTSSYGTASLSSQPIPEPPSAFGPSEPVPVLPRDHSRNYPTAPPEPGGDEPADLTEEGPALPAAREDSSDDVPQFPAATRRPLPLSRPAASQTGTPPRRPVGVESVAGSEPLFEPVPVQQLPALLTPPTGQANGRASDRDAGLRISRLALCREVRGYDDLDEVAGSRVASREPFLIYADLSNFRSQGSADGYRTITRSQVELRTRAGDVLWRRALGTATNLSPAPLHEHFLTHNVALPASIEQGIYVLRLRVEDLSGERAATEDIVVRVGR